MAIDYPKKPTRRDKVIAGGRAAAEQIPWFGAALSALGPILPDRIQEDEERWEREVTDELNAVARLCQRPTISRDSLAWLLALLAGKLDADGTGGIYVPHAYLMEEVVPKGAIESHYHPEFPFIWLYLNGAVRRVLREFAGL